MHTVPALVHDNLTLTDSQAILIYLAEYLADGRSLGIQLTNVQLRMSIINKLFFSGTILFDRDRAVFGDIFDSADNIGTIDKHLARIRDMYNVMELFLGQAQFMAGDTVGVWKLQSHVRNL